MSIDKADVIKHLEMIQGIINRMAANSFLLKGWSPTAAAALLALAYQNKDRAFALLGLLPILGFWTLDAYYLRKERLYRRLHDAVRQSLSDLTAIPKVELFCMDTTPYEKHVQSWWRTMWWSAVTIGVHGPVMLLLVAVAIFWR
jgi:hypothetical protein